MQRVFVVYTAGWMGWSISWSLWYETFTRRPDCNQASSAYS